MILLHPKAPFVFGAVMIGLVSAYLAVYHPMPGPLSRSHAQAVGGEGLADCDACHTSQGLAAGCLHCHAEIAAQVKEARGYHGFLLKDGPLSCRPCHVEHVGPDFPLVSSRSWQGRDPNQFSHEYVTFRLTGAHDRLTCPACHLARPSGVSALPVSAGQARPTTYLGLSQDCTTCHQDAHGGVLGRNCEECHGQEAFRPAKGFRHDDHYVLEGEHAKAACSACHLVAEPVTVQRTDAAAGPNSLTRTFGRVRGKTCQQCHASPHRASLGQDCSRCHLAADATWQQGRRGMSPDQHRSTGFALEGAHASLACEKCHPADLAYAGRHPDPAAPGYARRSETCQGCHADVHKGQFVATYKGCLDCHSKDGFVPSTFTTARHAQRYVLAGAHADLGCDTCHTLDPNLGARRYVATPKACQACHQDPHAGRFAASHASCLDCHSQDRFSDPNISATLHSQWYTLAGVHASLACKACHSIDPESGARRYGKTPRTCQACHKDPHAGQFAGQHSSCLECHTQSQFSPSTFTLSRHAQRYPLTGAHAAVPCLQCHPVLSAAAGRRFVSTPQSCQACHADPHGGQFSKGSVVGDCTSCHLPDATTFSVKTFDHGRRTGYELTGAHARATCQACHRPAAGSGQSAAAASPVTFRGTSRACASCHRDVHLGQFQEAGVTRCDRCHASTGRWVADRFDHNRDSRFPLEGAHAQAGCKDCHPVVRSSRGASVVQYRPLKSRCEDCHDSSAP